MKRDLDPQLSAILEAIAGGGMFDDGLTVAEMRERFELTAPMMWNPAPLAVDSVTDRVLDGPAGPLPIRVYRASPGTEPAPVLVYFHGGGFTIGSIDTAEAMCRFLAREAGCIVVSVGFRLAPEHPFPAPVEDCATATQWVRTHAAALGGDPARIAVGGDASGATYATVCAQLVGDTAGPPLVFQLLLSPCTDFANRHPSRVEQADDPLIPAAAIDALMDAYAPHAQDRTDPRCSPLLAPDLTRQPPAYLLAAEYDFLLDEERAYAGAAGRRGRTRDPPLLARHRAQLLLDVRPPRRRAAPRWARPPPHSGRRYASRSERARKPSITTAR